MPDDVKNYELSDLLNLDTAEHVAAATKEELLTAYMASVILRRSTQRALLIIVNDQKREIAELKAQLATK